MSVVHLHIHVTYQIIFVVRVNFQVFKNKFTDSDYPIWYLQTLLINYVYYTCISPGKL